MQIDWSTFLLQTVNFLILVWILRHFLYRPVLAVIARRRAEIERTLAEAHEASDKAAALRQEYEGRLSKWEAERETARASLKDEIAAERKRLLAQAREAAAAEQQRAQALEEARQREARRRAESDALALASDFVSRLAGRLAGQGLDERLLDMLLEDLASLPSEQRDAIREAAGDQPVEVASARELPASQLDRLRQGLGELTRTEPTLDTKVDPSLLSGLRVSVGPWVLGANLADELRFFRNGVSRAG